MVLVVRFHFMQACMVHVLVQACKQLTCEMPALPAYCLLHCSSPSQLHITVMLVLMVLTWRTEWLSYCEACQAAI